MKTVYFVRHGQSVDNVAPVFQSPDSPLSEKGKKQAKYVADRVSKLSFDALITSPLRRAEETARAIERVTGKTPETSDLFVERIKPTGINGKPYADEHAQTVWKEWEKSLYTSTMKVEDGENFDELTDRADRALAFLTSRPEDSLVVVTHGFFLRTIVARVLFCTHLTGEAFRQFQKSASMENTGLTVLRYQSDFEQETAWRLWVYNDHAHLG